MTIAGPVTIRRPDGSVEVRPPLGPKDLARLVKQRTPTTPNMRARIMRRDRGACRYCGQDATEIDHVVPVALGGTGRMGNLVAACQSCNARKGPRVWTPRPVDKQHPYALAGRSLDQPRPAPR